MSAIDFEALARVFVAMRPRAGEQGALRVAMFAAKVLAPGVHGLGMEKPIVRLARVFAAQERRARADAAVPMSELQVTAQALKRTLDWTYDPKPVLGPEVIEQGIRAAMQEHGIDRAKLMHGTARAVAAMRAKLWWELGQVDVGVTAIGRAFHRDHSTIDSGQRAHARRLLDAEMRRGPQAADREAA